MTPGIFPMLYFMNRLNRQTAPPLQTAVSAATNPPASSGKKILCGYWFEWQPRVLLTEIPDAFNIICVAFLEHDDGIPRFAPHFFSEREMIDGIKFLKNQGREVLISMGGASGRVVLRRSDKPAFKAEMIEIIDKYDFTGVDIDLEGGSITAGDNGTVIPETLREIKDIYRARGKDLLITMAPEFRYLRGYNASYQPYVKGLDGYYDFVWPQYYNQGADGIWSDEYQLYLSQNDDAHKEEFLYALTRAIVTGTQDFMKIPANKFAIGLPASPAAALNGYVKNPADVGGALNQLAAEGNEIRGLMTWSVNQDSATGYRFAKTYAPIIGR